jgi:hypothetical protein
MKKKSNKPSQDYGLLKVGAVIATIALISILATTFKSDETDVTLEAFTKRMSQFQHHIESSHWQWKVQQPTSMIMLRHYDNQGKERSRRPVPINHFGWPGGEMNDEGCEKLWTSLTAEPLNVDGFKVHARYYSQSNENSEVYWCRFGLSRGPYFDYFPATGKTSELEG